MNRAVIDAVSKFPHDFWEPPSAFGAGRKVFPVVNGSGYGLNENRLLISYLKNAGAVWAVEFTEGDTFDSATRKLENGVKYLKEFLA